MCPRAEQHAREKTWPALVAAHKRPGVPCGKEEAVARGSDRLQPTRNTALTTPQFIDLAGREIEADLSKPPDGRLTAASWCRHGQPPISSLIADEADDHPCLVAPASRWGAGPPPMRRPSSGGTNSAIRAQAVQPTATAPLTAKVTRQPSDGMPIWANPSVPL